jgi:hypothetical protein
VLIRKKLFLPEVEDFTIVERQIGPIARPAALGRALHGFLDGEDVRDGSYEFSLNTVQWAQKAIARLFSIGLICEAWNAKAYWVLDERLYQALVLRHGFEPDRYSPDHPVRFAAYSLTPQGDRLVLTLKRFASTSLDEIYRAMRDSSVPFSRGEFVESLNRHWVKTMKHALRMAVERKIRERHAANPQ